MKTEQSTRQSVPEIEPFKVRFVKTIYSSDFQSECFKWLYYYFAFFWVVMIILNIFIAFRLKNADLLLLCIFWFLLAWRYFKKGKEHNKMMKEVKNETKSKVS